jgi:hypothetical protein
MKKKFHLNSRHGPKLGPTDWLMANVAYLEPGRNSSHGQANNGRGPACCSPCAAGPGHGSWPQLMVRAHVGMARRAEGAHAACAWRGRRWLAGGEKMRTSSPWPSPSSSALYQRGGLDGGTSRWRGDGGGQRSLSLNVFP